MLTAQWRDEAEAFGQRDLSGTAFAIVDDAGVLTWRVIGRTCAPRTGSYRFAAVRLPIMGPESRAAAIAMAYKLIDAAQAF